MRQERESRDERKRRAYIEEKGVRQREIKGKGEMIKSGKG